MKIVQLNSITDKLFDLRSKGSYPGMATGFQSLNPFYNIRRGNTTYITGYPTSGKTQVYIQLLCNTTSLYDWKHVLYTPETGMAEEIYAEIIHCLTGKSFHKHHFNYISEDELMKVKDYVHTYFKVIEPEDNACSLEHWFAAVDEVQKEFDIDTAGIDNWNDLEHNMSQYGQKISEYLKYQLPKFNRFAKERNIHGFLLVHPRNPDIIKGQKFPDAPRPDQIEGGSLWYAKAQSILIVHRDWSVEDNKTTEIVIGKAKPKIVGKKGRIELEFDVRENCYYEQISTQTVYPLSQFKANKHGSEELQIAPF